MSDESREDGRSCYADGDSRDWFERQWAAWPTRVDQRYTTNISFLYGGVLAFRAEHGRDPKMSRDFASHVKWHDQHGAGNGEKHGG